MFAPVKAPLAYPNNSLSKSASGIALQLIATKGFSALLLFMCIALAHSSLPVPLSPLISIVELFLDILFILSFKLIIFSDKPIISSIPISLFELVIENITSLVFSISSNISTFLDLS